MEARLSQDLPAAAGLSAAAADAQATDNAAIAEPARPGPGAAAKHEPGGEPAPAATVRVGWYPVATPVRGQLTTN